VRLVEVALDAGAKAAYRVDFASELEDSWFEGVKTVGVSSGASVPEELVDEVLVDLARRGFGDVRTITTAEEDIQFSLPKELRKDLKSAGEDTSNKQKR
jgi:4-hydroxy-3-methylbut-2-enyl diphosphate reductase